MYLTAFFQKIYRWMRLGMAWGHRSRIGGLRDTGVAAQGTLRGLGLIYTLSFWSFAAQAQALCGPGGLSPISEVLRGMVATFGASAFWRAPSLFWLRADNAMLLGVLGLGTLAGLLLLAGVRPWAAALTAWVCQVSLLNACPQWLDAPGDALLAELGFWSLFLASPRWRRMPAPEDMAERVAGILFLRILLFRLLFTAGLAKLGDPLWRNATALFSFFETQPMPTAGGWFFHHLPEPVLTYALWGVMFVELALPFYLLLPRIYRNIAAGGFALHAVLAMIAGNMGQLPPLLLLLAFGVVDDVSWRKVLPEGWGPAAPLRSAATRRPAWPWMLLLLPVALSPAHAPAPWRQLSDWLAGAQAVHRYEVHTRISPRRLEIAVQGSPDGQVWREYRFKQKPADPQMLPLLALPHYPRLDLKMTEAAQPPQGAAPGQNQAWLYRFAQGLLAGDAGTAGLLADNPFQNQPPRFLRFVLYEYQFADPAARRREKVWWRRTLQGLYSPVMRREAP